MFEMTEANGITMIDESDSDDINNMEVDHEKRIIPSFSNYLIITLCFIMLCTCIVYYVVQLRSVGTCIDYNIIILFSYPQENLCFFYN